MNNFTVKYIFQAIDKISPVMNRARASVRKLSSGLKSMANATKYYSAVASAVLYKSLGNWDRQEKAVAQVRAGIKATGGIAGRSVEQLSKMARDLQKNTLFGDEEILGGATAQLLTFTNIAGEQFDRTQKAVLDVATKLATTSGGTADLTSTAIMLGKALNDPVANLGALGRSGIQFTKSQKKVIKKLSESGRVAEAQSLILTELEKQYGGASKAAAEAGTGGIKQMNNAIGDAMEVIGKLVYTAIKPAVIWIKQLAEKFQKSSPFVKKLVTGIIVLIAVLAPLLLLLSGVAFAVSMISLPVIAVVGAIGLLIAVGVALYKQWDKVTNFMKTTPLGKLIGTSIKVALIPIRLVIEAVKLLWHMLTKVGSAIKNSFVGKSVGKMLNWATSSKEGSPETEELQNSNSGSLNGNITIKNQSDKVVEGKMTTVGSAQGVGMNMEGAYSPVGG